MNRAFIPLDAHLAQLGLLITLVGLALGALVWTRPGRAFDRRTFRAINRLPTRPELDWIMWSITHLGSAWAAVGALAVSTMVQRPRFVVVTAMAILTQGILIGVAKALTQRPRPFNQLSGIRVIGLKPADLSYPSGHSALAFNVATLLAFGLPLAHPWPIVVYGLACAVGYSRLHLGVHYPFDVFSGATVGLGWGLLWVAYLHP